MSRLLTTFWIVSHCSIVAAIFWAGVLAFPIATTIHVLYGAERYRPAVFIIESLHYDSGANDTIEEAGGPSYWAMGWVRPGNRLERLSLHSFFEKPPTSQADMESVLRKGDVLRVLFNPEMTDMMVQDTTPRVLLDGENVWSKKRTSVKRMLCWALVPLFVTSVMVFLARRWAKSGPIITWASRPR
jgi:hypothetical protein